MSLVNTGFFHSTAGSTQVTPRYRGAPRTHGGILIDNAKKLFANQKKRKGGSLTKTVTKRKKNQMEVNYNAHVRHDRSALIYKKRKTLKRAWQQLEKSKVKYYSKYQCLTSTISGGNQVWWNETTRGHIGIGHYFSNVATGPGSVAADILPYHLFRLSDFPKAKHTSLSGSGTTSFVNYSPHVMYVMAKNGRTATSGNYPLGYYWSPNTGTTTTNENNQLLPNAYTITSKDGSEVSNDNFPALSGYTHEWSDIKLCFWAQDIPLEFTVQIVTMPDLEGHRMDIPGDGYAGVSTTLVQNIRTGMGPQDIRTPIVNYRDRIYANYTKPLNGHPNASDKALGRSFRNQHPWAASKHPWRVLRSEKFHIPASSSTDGEKQKVLKSLFYRSQKYYSGMDTHSIDTQAHTTSGIDDYTVEGNTDSASPFAMPGQATYLIICCKQFRKYDDSVDAGYIRPQIVTAGMNEAFTNSFGSYDICIEACHSHTNDDVVDSDKP